MPAIRIDMRKLKDALRLKFEGGQSHQQIAGALGISKGVVTKYVGLAVAAALDWPAIAAMDEATLERRLLASPRPSDLYAQPDYGRIHRELARKGVTLMLLWEEYAVECCQHTGSAILPIPWAPTLMRNCKHGHIPVDDLIHHRVRKVLEVVVPGAILVFRPVLCRFAQPINGIKQIGLERSGSNWASLEIPKERFARLCLRFRQHFNVEGTHRELRRWRTSAQGAVCTRPARNSARRRLTSARHRSETVASSAVSRLSRRATAKAERSSAGRPRTSSRRWSTRAFMVFSLAPRVPCGKGSMDNLSIDADTLLPRLRRAVVCRSFLR